MPYIVRIMAAADLDRRLAYILLRIALGGGRSWAASSS
jgi:hypothetical protein